MKQYPFHYVIVVGNVAEEINERNANYWNRRNQIKQFTVRNYLGALARLQVETKVIHVDNNQQAWTIMDRVKVLIGICIGRYRHPGYGAIGV